MTGVPIFPVPAPVSKAFPGNASSQVSENLVIPSYPPKRTALFLDESYTTHVPPLLEGLWSGFKLIQLTPSHSHVSSIQFGWPSHPPNRRIFPLEESNVMVWFERLDGLFTGCIWAQVFPSHSHVSAYRVSGLWINPPNRTVRCRKEPISYNRMLDSPRGPEAQQLLQRWSIMATTMREDQERDDGDTLSREDLDSPDPGAKSTAFQVSRWQAGDQVAFGVLHERFAPLLKRRVLRNRAWSALIGRLQVEDVVQEIWARVIPSVQKSFTPSGRGSFLAFLGRLSDRTVIDLARIQRAYKRGGFDAEQPLQTNAEPRASRMRGLPAVETPTSHARCAELETIARKFLGDREYQAWELVEMQGYAAEEAGLAMRCSDSAVRGLLLRGRAKLVTRLGLDDSW